MAYWQKGDAGESFTTRAQQNRYQQRRRQTRSAWGQSDRRGGSGGRVRCMDVQKLKLLRDDDNLENVTLELTSDRGGFGALLSRSSLSNLEVSLVLDVVSKACSSQHKESLKTVLKSVCTSTFLESHLVGFIIQLHFVEEIESVAKTVLGIVKSITNTLPRYSENCLPCLKCLQRVSCYRRLFRQYPELEDEIARAEKIVKEKVYYRNKTADDEEPPDNYRDLQMFPSADDTDWLEEPFLRKNKGKGAYADLDTYLDVQFRLLREDYIQPLRKGIQEYKRFGKGRIPNQLADMWLYHDVHVICSVCNEDVDTRLQFDVARVGRIRWQSTKRLIYGSLVCLSKDDFQTMLFATVTNRTTRDLLKGMIEVRFEKDFDTVLNITPTDTFTMAETPAYFEAYRHVLKRLQDIQDDLPFQNYIVECDTNVQPPAYLRVSCRYDLSSLGPPKYERYLNSVPVLDTDRWPPLTVYDLNPVQLDAVKTAVTKELAIIQGPPGTGKTYVGLKIMKVLLENKDLWTYSGSSNVILVVCYTNHALDQFLEGILEFHGDGIIRVGGRSNSEKLKDFNLKELRYNRRKNRQRRKSVYENYADCKKKMSHLKTDIETVGSKLEASMLGVLREETLRPFMASGHYTSLVQRYGMSDHSKILSWLKFKNPPKPSESDANRQKLVDDWTKAILRFVSRGNPDEESSHLDDIDLQNLDFIQRVHLYKSWVLQFRRNIKTEMAKIVANAAQMDTSRGKSTPPILLRLGEKLHLSNSAILADEHLRQFVPNTIYQFITTREKYSSCHEGCSIKVWLGASPFLTEDGLCSALQELEETNELNSQADEEADIITNQRYVDDMDRMFEIKPRKTAARLSRAVHDLALEFQSTTDSHSGWQSAEQQVYSEYRKGQKKRLNHILMGSPAMSDVEAQSTRNVWLLDISQRESLYASWVKKYQLQLKSSIQDKEREYRQVAKRLKEVLQEEDRDILAEADVIGMTTTGAAKHAAVLQIVAPRVIVVEEAAEVLEAHIITTLNPKCQHLILIGDHQQLRPNPTVYELARRYQLDISLFERLVKNNLHHVTLECQHRMRPEISVLMKHIYPKLEDHHSVTQFEDVLGVDSNVFFVSHSEEENHISESKSKSNEHEATFILALCKYFIHQGYDSSDITILAAYTGQISLIKRLMGSDKDLYQEVRLTSVDNFQGEECKIILLSFVRSNEAGSVGFLSTDNRVCVALSRAKVGMFAVGNFSLLAEKSLLWTKIVQTLKARNCFGDHLLLRCRNHPEMTVQARTNLDFEQAPKGGCSKVCGFELQCGHRCEKICHMDDRKHLNHKCNKPCRKMFVNCGHRCLKKCFQKCQTCTTMVTKTLPNCDHKVMISCSEKPDKCTSLCQKRLSCGHLCKRKCTECTDSRHDMCTEVVKKKLTCGHTVSKLCSSRLPQCPEKCGHRLLCGHSCTKLCRDCSLTGHVVLCTQKVVKTCQCGRKYVMSCSRPLTSCLGECSQKLDCGHTCKGKCARCLESGHELCSEPISLTLECGHNKTIVRYKRNRVNTCTQECKQKLDCGHTCTGKCVECFGSSHKLCPEKVTVTLKCGHRYLVKCCNSKKSFPCPGKCGKILKCGHRCEGNCNDCSTLSHELCEVMVDIKLTCGHYHQVKCFRSKTPLKCLKH